MQRVAAVRSGGQTGADRGALDAARDAGVPVLGWVPRGGWAEDRPDAPGIVADYPSLRETDSADTSERTVLNVRDSDATLVIGPDACSPGTELTLKTAEELGRPVFVYAGQDTGDVLAWIDSLGVGLVLNVAGPRESEAPGTYEKSYRIIRSILKTAEDLR